MIAAIIVGLGRDKENIGVNDPLPWLIPYGPNRGGVSVLAEKANARSALIVAVVVPPRQDFKTTS
jgi:hypothetical protein